MTGRRGYAIALVAAVFVLLLSVGGALVYAATTGGWHPNGVAVASDSQSADDGDGGWGGYRRGGRGGMMGDWQDQDTPDITADQATAAAESWAADHQPGAVVGTPVLMPMGYLIPVTEDGQSVGTILVDEHTGKVIWWRADQTDQSTPSSTAS